MVTTMDAEAAMYLTRLSPTPERAAMLAEAFRVAARSTWTGFEMARRDPAYALEILAMEAMRDLTADETAVVLDELGRLRDRG